MHKPKVDAGELGLAGVEAGQLIRGIPVTVPTMRVKSEVSLLAMNRVTTELFLQKRVALRLYRKGRVDR